MKKIIFLASACLMAGFTSLSYADNAASSTSASGIAGNYQCNGTNFVNGNKYSSKLQIAQTDQTYQFNWTSPDGQYKGTGLTGEDPSMLVVAFKKMNDPSFVGAQVYKISQDGNTFNGRWVIIGKNTVGTEVCQKGT